MIGGSGSVPSYEQMKILWEMVYFNNNSCIKFNLGWLINSATSVEHNNINWLFDYWLLIEFSPVKRELYGWFRNVINQKSYKEWKGFGIR